MRVFIIHLSPKTCQNFSLKETHITPLLESLKLQGVSYEIFDAIYSKISPTQLHPLILEHLHPSFMIEDLWAFCKNEKRPPCALKNFFYALKHCGKRMGFGELGCYASHYSLWQKCIELNEAICILEDDIIVKERFKESLEFCYQHINELGYIRLMHLEENVAKQKTFIKGVSQILNFKDGIGTQGYILAPKAAQKLLKYSAKEWVMPIDCVMDRHYWHGVKNYVLEEFAIACDGMNTQNSNTEKQRPKKLPLSIRIGRFLHKSAIKQWNILKSFFSPSIIK
ncbi:lipooligosaccharide 5G8 epitope biosynthesis-associated protein (lex2B) [Helicobacter pylori FD703]|uniref:glycosyltransferase family 25 protein n=1 Tax=Helicobacter pylori TaxID=210 RepID=UPI00036011B2|nr:glycosyltransferase family 25 protein [Helicobacter pylori]EQL66700.1 lipooligosaccharide 5G8 epitope biosynthesis-associated protein (lex2B) [Helicobacter pylori FD703]